MSVALDEADAASEWVEAAAPTYPVLVDPDHLIADRLGICNVPTAIWIDEDDRVVRPPVIAPADDMFRDFSGVDSAFHHDQLRAWVRNGTLPFTADEARAKVVTPTYDGQLARAERRLGAFLFRTGHTELAAQHIARAEELAPMEDWTIRRGGLPLRGGDPFGQEFFDFWQAWDAAGRPGYWSADKGG